MARHQPAFRWQIDWDNAGDYSHAQADVTDNMNNYGITFGAAVVPQGFAINRTSGFLALTNRGGIYNPDATGSLGPAILDKRHLCRRIEGTTTIWEGYAEPDNLRQVQAGETSTWNLVGKEAVQQDRDVALFQEGGDLATAAATVASDSGMTITAPTEPNVGVAWAEDSAVAVAAQLCRWAGCIGFEQDDGSVTIKSFPTLAAGTDTGTDFDFAYEPEYPPTCLFRTEPIRNYGLFESRSVFIEPDPVVLGRIEATIDTTQRFSYFVPYFSSPQAPVLNDFVATPSIGSVIAIEAPSLHTSGPSFIFDPGG